MNTLALDRFLHACDILRVHVALLLTGLFVHGYVPNEHCIADNGKQTNVTDSGNYRGITLRPTFT